MGEEGPADGYSLPSFHRRRAGRATEHPQTTHHHTGGREAAATTKKRQSNQGIWNVTHRENCVKWNHEGAPRGSLRDADR